MTETPVYLTRFQRTVVCHLFNGESPVQAARLMGVAPHRVRDSLEATRRKLRARTTIQAVHKAYLTGAVGPRPDCGTRLSYIRHLERDEEACPACRAANLRWLKAQADEPLPAPPLDDVHLRIIRAFHCGRARADLMQLWSVSSATLDRHITELYRRLGVTGAPRVERRERALDVALERGYLRPEGARAAGPARLPVLDLSARETEILAALRQGGSLAEVGARLRPPLPRTSVASRLTEIYRKLDVAHLPRDQKRSAALRAAHARGYSV